MQEVERASERRCIAATLETLAKREKVIHMPQHLPLLHKAVVKWLSEWAILYELPERIAHKKAILFHWVLLLSTLGSWENSFQRLAIVPNIILITQTDSAAWSWLKSMAGTMNVDGMGSYYTKATSPTPQQISLLKMKRINVSRYGVCTFLKMYADSGSI